MISFIIIGILFIFLLKKNLNYFHSLIVISLNLCSIFYFYNYEFLGFEDDSKDYYNNTKILFDNFTLKEIIFGLDQLDTESLKHPYFSDNLFAKIYLFFYLIFLFLVQSLMYYLFFIYSLNVYHLFIFQIFYAKNLKILKIKKSFLAISFY